MFKDFLEKINFKDFFNKNNFKDFFITHNLHSYLIILLFLFLIWLIAVNHASDINKEFKTIRSRFYEVKFTFVILGLPFHITFFYVVYKYNLIREYINYIAFFTFILYKYIIFKYIKTDRYYTLKLQEHDYFLEDLKFNNNLKLYEFL